MIEKTVFFFFRDFVCLFERERERERAHKQEGAAEGEGEAYLPAEQGACRRV